MELCREVGVSFEAVVKEVCKLICHLKYEANAGARIFFSVDQLQTLLIELRD